jgi:CubicO group peptidase (beta-lactamase class C family)
MTNESKSTKSTTRILLLLIIIVAVAGVIYYVDQTLNSPTKPTNWPTITWASGTAEQSGFDSQKLAEAIRSMKGTFNIHSLTIASSDGGLFLDTYFYPYDGSTYHDLASVTKSVTTTLIAIAADQGKLDLDGPILNYFPDYNVANRDARKEKVTIRHLAGMTSGFYCIDYPTEATLEEMLESQNWVQFALDRPMTADPGTHFAYDSLGMHLLSAILEKATGMTELEYAKQVLFTPLGITEVCWPSDQQGHTKGWGDLCLHPRNAAKIGLLFIHRGNWDGKQIVSLKWVSEATKKHISTNRGQDYGYGWWVSPSSEPIPYYSAEGRGGQYIRVYPTLNIIISATGGGYSMGDIGPMLAEAITDGGKALPANPNGVETLKNAAVEVGAKPKPTHVAVLPNLASIITGKTYIFDSNTLGLESMKLEFDAGSEAIIILEKVGEIEPRLGVIGLDGVYRMSSSGQPAAAKGFWSGNVFTLDYYEGPGLNYLPIKFIFEDDTVRFNIQGFGEVVGRPSDT